MNSVEEVFKILSVDPKFIERVKISLDNIMRDGKVDQFDAPEIIFLITDAYIQIATLHLSVTELPILIKMLYTFIVEKFDIIPVDKREDFNTLVDVSIKLVMLQPNFNANDDKKINKCVSWFKCFQQPTTQLNSTPLDAMVAGASNLETKPVEPVTLTTETAVQLTEQNIPRSSWFALWSLKKQATDQQIQLKSSVESAVTTGTNAVNTAVTTGTNAVTAGTNSVNEAVATQTATQETIVSNTQNAVKSNWLPRFTFKKPEIKIEVPNETQVAETAQTQPVVKKSWFDRITEKATSSTSAPELETKPAQQAQPAQPAQQAQQAEQTQPTESAEQTQPTQPAEQTQPIV